MSTTTNEPLKYVPTTCPYCGVGCGLNLVVSEGKLVGVEPYKRSPINEGKLCPKGMTCWEHVQSPDRLTTPKIKKNGKFVDASWDEALDLIAKKFKETSDKYGPKSLGFQTSCRTVNEDCYALQKLARVGFQTNNVDNCARICHGPSVAGLSLSFGSGAATNPFEDVLNSDLIVMWGSNAVEAHPLAGRRVMQAKKKGIPIVVVDPRFSATARLADKWIRFNPSTHIALANTMMYWIIKEGLEDKEFIKERTKGFEDLKKTVEKYADADEDPRCPARDGQGVCPPVCEGKERGHHLLPRHHRVNNRYRQRPFDGQPLAAHRQHRTPGCRCQPAPWPEQRAGCLRHGCIPERLLRLPGCRSCRQPCKDGEGMGHEGRFPARLVRCDPNRADQRVPATRSRRCISSA